jgi:3-hydroxyacyl-[acyl-carrier-protein] dehydratase
MAFDFVDTVAECESGRRIVALKCLSMGEEYLRDHFPRFPVMPGVLMLECMFQAAAWLFRVTDDFTHSTIILSEARSVKFRGFVRPGQTLRVSVDIETAASEGMGFYSRGAIVDQGDEPVVTAKLLLKAFNLSDTQPERAHLDQLICRHLRNQWAVLSPRRQVTQVGT